MSALGREDFVGAYLGFTPGPAEPTLERREAMAAAVAEAVLAPEQAAFLTAAASVHRGIGATSAGRNFITSVKDQGGCGSCVAFGTCATVEGTLRANINDANLPVDLSEAWLLAPPPHARSLLRRWLRARFGD